MGLNVKLSLVVCIGFIAGMVWLVNEVGRPIRQMKIADSLAAAHHGPRPTAETVSLTPVTTGKFKRESASEAPAVPVAASSIQVPPPAVVSNQRTPVQLPPLHWPEPIIETETPAVEVAMANPESPAHLPPIAADGDIENNGKLQTPAREEHAAPFANRPGRWPPGSQPQDEKLVAEKAADKAQPEKAKAEKPAEPAKSREYVVQKGDTLSKIAHKYYKTDDPQTLNAITVANRKLQSHPGRLVAGETIVLPADPTARKSLELTAKTEPRKSEPASKAEAAAGRNEKPEKATLAANVKTKGRAAGKTKAAEPREYTVRANDSLASIARKLLGDERRWRELQKLNRLPSDTRLQAGARLKLPADRA